jgi:hypothetical protein
MRWTKKAVVQYGVVLLAALAVMACGDDPMAPDNAGRLTIRLTDAPVDEIRAVNVYIEGLKVKRAGSPEQDFAVDVGRVDLLTLTDSSILLATHAVEAGEYEYIMVELDETRSSIAIDFLDMSLRIPSEKIKVLGSFQVTEDGTTTVTLDFDARQSVQQLGNGAWLMTPIIVMAEVQGS